MCTHAPGLPCFCLCVWCIRSVCLARHSDEELIFPADLQIFAERTFFFSLPICRNLSKEPAFVCVAFVLCRCKTSKKLRETGLHICLFFYIINTVRESLSYIRPACTTGLKAEPWERSRAVSFSSIFMFYQGEFLRPGQILCGKAGYSNEAGTCYDYDKLYRSICRIL